MVLLLTGWDILFEKVSSFEGIQITSRRSCKQRLASTFSTVLTLRAATTVYRRRSGAIGAVLNRVIYSCKKGAASFI